MWIWYSLPGRQVRMWSEVSVTAQDYSHPVQGNMPTRSSYVVFRPRLSSLLLLAVGLAMNPAMQIPNGTSASGCLPPREAALRCERHCDLPGEDWDDDLARIWTENRDPPYQKRNAGIIVAFVVLNPSASLISAAGDH
jgi:hypothetical protein